MLSSLQSQASALGLDKQLQRRVRFRFLGGRESGVNQLKEIHKKVPRIDNDKKDKVSDVTR